MKKGSFTEAERLACRAIIKKHEYRITLACADECRAALGRYISDRSLRTYRDDMLAPVKKVVTRRTIAEAAEANDLLPGSADSTSETSAQVPPIDVSGLSRVELLDRAIDERLKRLVQQTTATSDQALAKVVSDLMESRRRELSIPTPVMDALTELGILYSLLQEVNAINAGEAEPGEEVEPITLGSYTKRHNDALREAIEKLRRGELSDGKSEGEPARYERSAQYSNHSIPELVAELDTLMNHHDWLTIQSHEAWRFDSMEKGHVLGMIYRPRAVDDVMPELLEFYREERQRVDIRQPVDLRPYIRALREQRAAAQVKAEPTIEAEEVREELEEPVESEPTPEPEPEPEPIAAPAAKQPPAELSDVDRALIDDKVKAEREYAQLKREKRWDDYPVPAKIILYNRMGITPKREDLL